jgi:hypothetical protein
MASNPAATDSTANLFTSAPFDRDSNSKAPPATWCSIYRGAVIRSRAAAMTRERARFRTCTRMRLARRDLPSATLWYPAMAREIRGCFRAWVRIPEDAAAFGVLGRRMLTGVDDHAVGEVGAIRAGRPAAPLLHRGRRRRRRRSSRRRKSRGLSRQEAPLWLREFLDTKTLLGYKDVNFRIRL